MKNLLHVTLLLSLFIAFGYAKEGYGTLSFVLLKEGKALAQNDIIIDGEMSLQTDNDGYLNKTLSAGMHMLEVVGREKERALVYAKKPFMIVDGQNTQLIITLNQQNTPSFEDIETPKANTQLQDDQNLSQQPKGVLHLHIVTSEEKKPIGGARIFVKGMAIEGRSDKDGNVTITLPQGVQTISIIHGSYSSQTLSDIPIAATKTTEKSVEMTPSSLELEEFIVLVPHIEGSIASMVAEEKNSDTIANIVGSQQMARQGDSNAASALKRIAGITVIGGKSIYVRGLGDRYSSTELNGMSLPSPNPIKRTVPLDMFPSGVIGSLQVQKSFSPDITGAFGGGYVNVRTKKGSDEDYAKIKLGTKMHSSYGKDATTYKGSSSDWSGKDHSYRPFANSVTQSALPVVGERPPILEYDAQEMQAMYQKRDLNVKQESVPLGFEAQVELSKNVTIADEHQLNFLLSYGYKNESQLLSYTSHDYIISSSGEQKSEADNTAVNDLYCTTIQHGGIFNASYTFRNFDLRYTKFYVLNTLNQTRDIIGTFGENNSNEHQLMLEWQERELNIDQINTGIDYVLWTPQRFDVGIEAATASEYVPNDVSYNYKKYFDAKPYEFKRPDGKLTYNHRSTDDSLTSFYLKNHTNIPLLDDEDYIELGYMGEHKEREGRRVEIEMQSKLSDETLTSGPINDIINYGDGSHMNNNLNSKAKDQYDASLERNAFYLKGLSKPLESFEITYGARQVNLKQHVDQFDVEQNSVVTEPNKLDFNKLLPSFGLKYAPNDTHQFRAAYSQTFIYPDFREFVNTEFIHPVFLAKVSGNPNLQETDIQNYDLRYDYYFSRTESIAMALFYKHMKNPIEDTQEFTTSTLPRYSFDNSNAADLSGIELSWYKNFDFLGSFYERFIFSGNYTYIDSKVSLTDEQKAKFVTQSRGLQGLSPEVINLSLGYSEENSRSLNLSYNKMSKRLMRVALKNGNVVLGLDDYEIPPHLLDFTWIETFNVDALSSKMNLTFKIRNLLDGTTLWEQGSNTTLSYKTGREYSLSLDAKF